MSKQITCQQVHDALVDSIELRWKPYAKNPKRCDVPSCQLCNLDSAGNDFTCQSCPLDLIGQGCGTHNSAWSKWLMGGTKKNAKNMIAQLQKCLDTYFPKGWDK